MGEKIPDPAPAVKPGVKFLLFAALASGLFSGFSPIAPATVTSLFALVPAYLLARTPGRAALIIVFLFFFGVYLAGELEKVWGKDPARVTIDEIVGTLITFFYIPVSLPGVAVGFLLWRGFDILKPPFVNRVQRLQGGWGVMLDDVLSGILANLVLRGLVWVLPVLGRRS